jgi:hypothetical protein
VGGKSTGDFSATRALWTMIFEPSGREPVNYRIGL